jgi:hypothetical protein
VGFFSRDRMRPWANASLAERERRLPLTFSHVSYSIGIPNSDNTVTIKLTS